MIDFFVIFHKQQKRNETKNEKKRKRKCKKSYKNSCICIRNLAISRILATREIHTIEWMSRMKWCHGL